MILSGHPLAFIPHPFSTTRWHLAWKPLALLANTMDSFHWPILEHRRYRSDLLGTPQRRPSQPLRHDRWVQLGVTTTSFKPLGEGGGGLG